ncbi:MAG: peroxidase family protein [Ahrensia sp.]
MTDQSKPTVHGRKTAMVIEGEGPVSDAASGFRFGRLFPSSSQPPVILKVSTCAILGDRMVATPEMSRKDSDIPAGYTYFGQFVDHDISFDNTKKEADVPETDEIEPTRDNDLIQKRSPSLDLDSLYGGTAARDTALFDGAHFKIGTNSPSVQGKGAIGKTDMHNDLPRAIVSTPKGPKLRAQIGDERNDENLVVAQTHLMWLKFHNHVVDLLQAANPSDPETLVFEQAKALVTRHYQHIVLHDFVKRFTEAKIFEDVIVKGNRRVMTHGAGEVPFMPLEFSVAAYRHGHSQVREVYDWNVNFGTGSGILPSSPFGLLFDFSGGSGTRLDQENLPTNWVADFRRLYDFSEHNLPNLSDSVVGQIGMAKSIDPYIAPALGNLPGLRDAVMMGKAPFANLAALNLRRGSMRALPSGQDVSRQLSNVKMLTEAKMRAVIDPQFADVMERFSLFERTPLWLYILLEAADNGGNQMGALGSTIVCETFLTLVLTSRTSIINGSVRWTPDDDKVLLNSPFPLDRIDRLLVWMDERKPIIDPLQDSRNLASA